MAYNGFESGIYPLPNKSIVTKPEKSSSSEHPISSEKSSSSKHSSNYHEYIPPWQKYQEKASNDQNDSQTNASKITKSADATDASKSRGNTSENLLNEIHKIMYSLYQAKEITKKVYNNIMNSIKL